MNTTDTLTIEQIIDSIIDRYVEINLEGTKEALKEFDEDKRAFLGYLINRVREANKSGLVISDQQLIEWFTSVNSSTEKKIPFSLILQKSESGINDNLVHGALDKNIMEIRNSRL